jgi:hypothetical protein
MQIVPACMHLADLFRCEWQSGHFLDWKSIHVAPKDDAWAATFAANFGNHSASPDTGSYHQSHRRQFVCNNLGRSRSFEPELRMGVEIATNIDQPRFHRIKSELSADMFTALDFTDVGFASRRPWNIWHLQWEALLILSNRICARSYP